MESQYYSAVFNSDLNLLVCVNVVPPSDSSFFSDVEGRMKCADSFLYERNSISLNGSKIYEILVTSSSRLNAIEKAKQLLHNYLTTQCCDCEFGEKSEPSHRDSDCCNDGSSGSCGDDCKCEENGDEFPSIKCDKCDVDAEEIFLSRDIISLITNDSRLKALMTTYVVQTLLANIRVLNEISSPGGVYDLTTDFSDDDYTLFYDYLSLLVDHHIDSLT